MLLPLYADPLASWRGLAAVAVALLIVVLLFLRLNLHYLNLLFVFRGLRVFTITPAPSESQFGDQEPFVLISPRGYLRDGASVKALRVSNTVYLEDEEQPQVDPDRVHALATAVLCLDYRPPVRKVGIVEILMAAIVPSACHWRGQSNQHEQTRHEQAQLEKSN
jgi:hypothetical protein